MGGLVGGGQIIHIKYQIWNIEYSYQSFIIIYHCMFSDNDVSVCPCSILDIVEYQIWNIEY